MIKDFIKKSIFLSTNKYTDGLKITSTLDLSGS